jgi:hypothetical protein
MRRARFDVPWWEASIGGGGRQGMLDAAAGCAAAGWERLSVKNGRPFIRRMRFGGKGSR